MMGGGGSGGGGAGSNPRVMLPPRQEEAADQWWNTLTPMLGAAANAGAGTPAGQNYPTAQSFLSRYLTGTGADAPLFNDMVTRAFQPAYTAGQYAATDLFPRGVAQGNTLNQLGVGGIPYAQQALSQGFDPRYGLDTPEFAQQMAGAQRGATMGGAGADQIFNQAGQVGGLVNPLITSGFDPRSALFNRSRQQLMDQTNATNAMAGLGGTPYGASVAANAMGNFDINWQNQQLARQAQAAEAARGAAGTSSALYSAAPGVAQSSAAMPNQAILQQLASRNAGAASGLGNYATATGNIGNLFQGAQNAGTQAAQTAMQFGAAPYNLGAGMANNALQGLTSATNLGQQQYQLPRQLMGDLAHYMGLGQSAAQTSGQLQNNAFNQTAQGIGGLLGGANTLFGGGGGGGLMGGLGGLLGGGGMAAADIAGLEAAMAASGGALTVGPEVAMAMAAPASI